MCSGESHVKICRPFSETKSRAHNAHAAASFHARPRPWLGRQDNGPYGSDAISAAEPRLPGRAAAQSLFVDKLYYFVPILIGMPPVLHSLADGVFFFVFFYRFAVRNTPLERVTSVRK